MKIYVCNALALGMLDREVQRSFNPKIPRGITLEIARSLVGKNSGTEIIGAVGHADTARAIADALGLPLDMVHARISVKLGSSDYALIGAYTGPRLPEGATSLPRGAKLEWWIV